MRDRGWRRKKDFNKAKRKRDIDTTVSWFPSFWVGFSDGEYIFPKRGMYNNLHQYSKNKIHCSCAYCSSKTRNKGHKRYLPKNYSPSINYSRHDKRKYDSMIEEEKEFIYGEENNSIME